MVSFALRALVLICLLAQLLAVPVLGIALQDEAELAEFHNHALTPWPSLPVLRADPAAYFRRTRVWLSEHIFPVQLATRVQKTLLLRWLHEPPEPRISLGADGHIFLNGGSNQHLYGLFAAGCVHAHSPSVARALEAALRYWAGVAQGRGFTSDFVVVPTAATLYADKLPEATPRHLRDACLQRMRGHSALLSVQPPAGNHFIYPLGEMLAAKQDEAFYPKGNWHPVGLSLQVARDAYLTELGVHARVRESLHLGRGPAEILMTYGIDWERPRYFLDSPFTSIAAERDSAVRSAIAPLFRGDRFITHVYTNTHPALDEGVLMLSDSFGDLSAQAFAGAFRTLVQVNLNDLQSGIPSQVIERVRKIERIDRVIFLIQEGNAPQLAGWR